MTDKTLTTTLLAGLMSTCLFPRRSALTMLFKQSLRTETRVILEDCCLLIAVPDDWIGPSEVMAEWR